LASAAAVCGLEQPWPGLGRVFCALAIRSAFSACAVSASVCCLELAAFCFGGGLGLFRIRRLRLARHRRHLVGELVDHAFHLPAGAELAGHEFQHLGDDGAACGTVCTSGSASFMKPPTR
jgi:hypothetical protein